MKNDKVEKEVKDSKLDLIKEEPTGGVNPVVIIIIAIILIIAAFAAGYYFRSGDSDLVVKLSSQLNQSQKTNTNINAYASSLESQLDDYKSLSREIKTGIVPFWNEDGDEVLNLRVPMDSATVKKATLDIIKIYSDDSSNSGYKIEKSSKSGKLWTVEFSCDKNISENNFCNGSVSIDEENRMFKLFNSE